MDYAGGERLATGSTPRGGVLAFGPATYAVSGVATHVRTILESALKSRYQIEHFQVGRQGRSGGEMAHLWQTVASPFNLIAAIFRKRPSVLHINTSLDRRAFWRDAVYAAVGRCCGTPVLMQVHGGDLASFVGGSHLRQRLVAAVFRLAGRIVVLNETQAEQYPSKLGLERPAVIPNAIDVRAFPTGHVPEARILQCVYIGRLAENKGVHHAVEAIGLLSEDERAHLRFAIAGTGPYQDRIRERILALGVDDAVRLIGPVEGAAKIALWASADLFIFPTYHLEGLPYAVLESLASATPVLTTKLGAVGGTVRHGYEGWIVPPHSPESIAQVLRQALASRETLERMSAGCRARALGEFDLEIFLRRLDALYAELGAAPARMVHN